MNACICAILNKKKYEICDICHKDTTNILNIPIYYNKFSSNKDTKDNLTICKDCFMHLVQRNVLTISFKNNGEHK